MTNNQQKKRGFFLMLICLGFFCTSLFYTSTQLWKRHKTFFNYIRITANVTMCRKFSGKKRCLLRFQSQKMIHRQWLPSTFWAPLKKGTKKEVFFSPLKSQVYFSFWNATSLLLLALSIGTGGLFFWSWKKQRKTK